MATAPKKKPDVPTTALGTADLRNIRLDQIIAKAGFNPRDVVGDVSDLVEMIQRGELINPITVTPATDCEGEYYYLIAGARRLKAVEQLGHAVVPCSVRAIDITSPDALALALVENDADGRQALTPLQTARAYKRLFDVVEGKTATDKHKAIAKLMGRRSEGAYQNIRVTLRLLDLDAKSLSLLESGGLSKWAAVTLTEIPEDVRAAVSERLKPGMSEGEVRRIAQDARREKEVGLLPDTDATPVRSSATVEPSAGDEPSQPVQRSPSAVSDIVLWRNKSEVREKIDELVADLVDATEDESEPVVMRCRDRIAALLWCTGVIKEVSTTDRDFKQALADLVEKAENSRGRSVREG